MSGLSRGAVLEVVNLFREKYYAGIKDAPELHVKLTGSWETLVGQQDTFGMSSTSFRFSRLDIMLCSISSSYT